MSNPSNDSEKMVTLRTDHKQDWQERAKAAGAKSLTEYITKKVEYGNDDIIFQHQKIQITDDSFRGEQDEQH